MVPPGLVLIAKIGPTLPKTVHQSFSSTDKLTTGRALWMLYPLGLLLLYCRWSHNCLFHQQWSILLWMNNASTAVSGYSYTNNYMNASTIDSAVNQGSVNYFLQFLQYQEFSTSLSICSQVSWYYCLQPSLHHTILPYHPVRGTCQTTVTIHMHRTTLGRQIGHLERWIGKWSLLSLKTLDQVVYHVSGYNHTHTLWFWL